MTRLRIIMLLILIVAAVGMRSYVPVSAQTGDQASTAPCSNATLNSGYAMKAEGFAVFPSSTTTLPFHTGDSFPLNFLGTVRFNGAGGLTGAGDEAAGGVIEENVPFDGTYTVSVDCTGTMTIVSHHPPPRGNEQHRLKFIIHDPASRFTFFFADPFLNLSGSAERKKN